nr:FAD/NAD(P)-binding protein [uncultured Gellertiella sp.]
MHKKLPLPGITRRDFLSGTALAIGAGLTPLTQLFAAENGAPYPPALTGLRGSAPGSFETAHALAREGRTFNLAGAAIEESHDLVVVGAGISGLSAAWFYRRKHGDKARILILDNHDDFGGHARRNEFTVDGKRLLIGYGGSESLEAPTENFSPEVWGLLDELGLDVAKFADAFDDNLYEGLGLGPGVFFGKEAFGTDRLVQGDPTDWSTRDGSPKGRQSGSRKDVISAFPMSEKARAELLALFEDPGDYLKGMSSAERKAFLSKTSYRDYLLTKAGLSEEAVSYFDGATHDYFAVGPDAIPASWALEADYPGFAGLEDGELGGKDTDEPYIYHFPDGNAGLARMLLRGLVPGAVAGHTMDDIVLSNTDYAKLDLAENAVRLRLNSTVINVQNAEGGVNLAYVRDGKIHRVSAGATVLACYNMIIPYLMPELPADQKAALSANVKAPLVYASVAIRNWKAFAALGVDEIYCPRSYFPLVRLDFPVSMGGYKCPRSPEEPIVVHMVHVPVTPGLSQNDQFRAGRQALLDTSFLQYELAIIDQLDRMLGTGGFSAARDIGAITVNRWPHGYAGSFNPLYDPPGADEMQKLARKPKGRVAIANADAGWNAFAHEAIDQAFRAVSELG